MSATYWFDAASVMERVRAGLEDGLDEAAERIAANARQRAPIRKVFREARSLRARTRMLTASEKEIATRLANSYYGSRGMEFQRRRAVAHIAHYATVRLPTRKSANTLANSRADRNLGTITGGRFSSTSGASRLGRGFEPGSAVKPKLTSRGLYEVRSGRAIHMAAIGRGNAKRVQIGGALKASIGVGAVRETAGGVEVTVAARIRYAKFVEFPTIHNRAQPFLLPALKDEQRTFTKDVASSIRRSLGGG